MLNVYNLKLIEWERINATFSPIRKVKMQLSVSCRNRLFGHYLAEEVIMISIVIYVRRREKTCLQSGKKKGLTFEENTYFPRKTCKSCGERGILIELRLAKRWLAWV